MECHHVNNVKCVTQTVYWWGQCYVVRTTVATYADRPPATPLASYDCSPWLCLPLLTHVTRSRFSRHLSWLPTTALIGRRLSDGGVLLRWRDMGWCGQTVACWIVAKYWATCATDRAWWSAVIPTTIWNYLSCYVKSGDQPIGNTPPQHIGKVISSNIIYKYELTLVVRLQRGWFCELNKKAFVC